MEFNLIIPFLPIPGIFRSAVSRNLRCNNLDSLGGLNPNCCTNIDLESNPEKFLWLTLWWKSLELPSDPHSFPLLETVESEPTDDAAESVELFESECSNVNLGGILKKITHFFAIVKLLELLSRIIYFKYLLFTNYKTLNCHT